MLVIVISVVTIWGDEDEENYSIISAVGISLAVSWLPCTVDFRSSQRDTTWTTADNRVQFYIPKDYSDMTGEFRSSNSEVLFQISFGPYDPYVSIYAWRGEESVIRDNEIELWKSISVKPGKYTVRVEETTYFTPGEILTFYCVNGNHLDDPAYLQAEIAKIQREERKSQWITRGILGGVVLIAAAIVVLLLRRKRRRK